MAVQSGGRSDRSTVGGGKAPRGGATAVRRAARACSGGPGGFATAAATVAGEDPTHLWRPRLSVSRRCVVVVGGGGARASCASASIRLGPAYVGTTARNKRRPLPFWVVVVGGKRFWGACAMHETRAHKRTHVGGGDDRFFFGGLGVKKRHAELVPCVAMGNKPTGRTTDPRQKTSGRQQRPPVHTTDPRLPRYRSTRIRQPEKPALKRTAAPGGQPVRRRPVKSAPPRKSQISGGARAWATVMRGGGRRPQTMPGPGEITDRNYRQETRRMRNELFNELTPYERLMVLG